MKKTIISIAFSVLIGVTGAFGQSGTGTSTGTTIYGTVPEAPVGHRQPRASDVPNNVSNNEYDMLSKENANLDKIIKGICRGC